MATLQTINKIILTKTSPEGSEYITEVWWNDDGHPNEQYGFSTASDEDATNQIHAIFDDASVDLGG